MPGSLLLLIYCNSSATRPYVSPWSTKSGTNDQCPDFGVNITAAQFKAKFLIENSLHEIIADSLRNVSLNCSRTILLIQKLNARHKIKSDIHIEIGKRVSKPLSVMISDVLLVGVARILVNVVDTS